MNLFQKLYLETENSLNESPSQSAHFEEMALGYLIKQMNAISTPLNSKDIVDCIPFALDMFRTNREFKLMQFLQKCEFYEIPRQQSYKITWYETAGVTPSRDHVIFLYDRKFMNELLDFYYQGTKVTKKIFIQHYKENPDDSTLRVNPGRLFFLIAHEAMHIFRHHTDRRQTQGLNGQIYNIAADSVINWTLVNDVKQIAGKDVEFIKSGIMLDAKDYKDWLKLQSKTSINDEEENFRTNLNADKTYYYYLDKNPPPPPTPAKVGQLRRITKGPNKGKVIRVKKIRKDGQIEGEEVSLRDEIEKIKSLNKSNSGGVKI